MRPTEVTLLAKMMDPTVSDESKDLARDMIEALDASRVEREQWVIYARTLKDGPIITVGPFNTKTQAMKASKRIAFADDPQSTPGLGMLITSMRHPVWLDKF